MSFDAARFDEAWARYVAAIKRTRPDFGEMFEAGASDSAVAAAEQAIGRAFPADLRHLLSRHDGGKDGLFVLPGWELFSAARIVDEWKIWEELRRNQFVPEGVDCEPEGPAKGDEWWRLGWIPFCGDGGGNHLCVDMDPAEGGTPGQVITMWHDDSGREVIDASLTDLMETIADDADEGELVWDEEMGGVYAPVEEDVGDDDDDDGDDD